MTDHYKEFASALLDDQTTGHELSSTLTALREDDQTKRALARYQMIGECIRHDRADLSSLDIAARVSARLVDEPTVLAPPRRSAITRHWQAAAGLAMAATLAGLAVWLGPKQAIERADVGMQQIALQSPRETPQRPLRVVRVQQPVNAEQLERLLVEHSGFAGQSGVPQFLPYVSVVSHDAQR